MSEATNKNDKFISALAIGGASLPITEGALVGVAHGGIVGGILAVGASGIVWLVADEMAKHGRGIKLSANAAPAKRDRPPGEHSVLYRMTHGKDARGEMVLPEDEKATHLLPETRQALDDEEMEELDEDSDILISEGMTFRELVQLGVIQKALAQGKMVLGFANGELRYGTWKDFNSAGIGGVSGSGKTTTVRFLLFQTVLLKGRFIMIDPHIEEKEESLAAQFRVFKNSHVFPPCDDNGSAVTKRVRWLMKEYLRRKEGGIKGPPIILVLDELNALIRRLSPELRKELTDLLLTIAQEGRKFGLFALLIAQRWSEQDLGGKPWGVAIRTSLSSMLAHRFTDEDQAKKLIGSKNGPRCLDLERGGYLFRDTEGRLTRMDTPDTCEEDGNLVLGLLGQSGTVAKSRLVPVQQQPANNLQRSGVMRSPYYEQTVPYYATSYPNGVAPSGSTSVPPSNLATMEYPFEGASEEARSGNGEGAYEGAEIQFTDREQEILDMFLKEKLTAFQIAKHLSGATGGTEYTKASNEVAEVFRKAMRG